MSTEIEFPKKIIAAVAREAYLKDIAKGTARIDYDDMEALGVQAADYVEIKGPKGGKGTVARCLPLYPSDENKNMVRIDNATRINAGAELGTEVFLCKVSPPVAARVAIQPMQPLELHASVDFGYVPSTLETMALTVGDMVLIPYYGKMHAFTVLAMEGADNLKIASALVDKDATTFTILNSGKEVIGLAITELVKKTLSKAGDVEERQAADDPGPVTLHLRLELSLGSITERIDFQKEVASTQRDRILELVRRCSQIARSKVDDQNRAIAADRTLAIKLQDPLDESELDSHSERIRERLVDLKHEIVMEWAYQ